MAWAVIYGTNLQDEAYLATTTRLWQLAFGGLMALSIDHLPVSQGSGLIMGWVGLMMVLSTGLIFDGGQQFPGPLALWPLLGWLLYCSRRREGAAETGSVTQLLNNRVFSWIGDYSYTLYLWHWPLPIFISLYGTAKQSES